MFNYVYILVSINYHDKHYTGYTEDLYDRLKKHNEGVSPYTSKYKPWKIKNAFAFEDTTKVPEFEKYLKSNSRRAFAQKHF